MTRDEYLAAIHREGDALLEAARRDMTAHVPSCPEWHIRDLLRHVAGVHSWVVHVLEQDGGPPQRRPAPSDDEYQKHLDAVIEALEAVSMDKPMWTWNPAERTAAFWFQRMAQETAVHRWDAELATGTPPPIEPALAADGVDEVSERFLTVNPLTGDEETIHLHATDAECEWLWRLHSGGTEVTRGHAKGDVAVRGTASDILLSLWGRIPADRLELLGEPHVFVDAVGRMRFGR